jgi:hypothetical protein
MRCLICFRSLFVFLPIFTSYNKKKDTRALRLENTFGRRELNPAYPRRIMSNWLAPRATFRTILPGTEVLLGRI